MSFYNKKLRKWNNKKSPDQSLLRHLPPTAVFIISGDGEPLASPTYPPPPPPYSTVKAYT